MFKTASFKDEKDVHSVKYVVEAHALCIYLQRTLPSVLKLLSLGMKKMCIMCYMLLNHMHFVFSPKNATQHIITSSFGDEKDVQY